MGPKDLSGYRSLFPIIQRFTFLNHAAVSSPSARVVEAMHALFDEFSACGISCYGKWMGRIDAARALFARLIGALPHEVAFVGNTSDGLSAVAGGLDWQRGDEILVPLPDFPSNIYPWMNVERYGVQVRFIRRRDGRFDAADVERLLQPRTRLLAVSSVDFSTGFACDLEALGDLCRRKGLLFCVDAIQSLGVIPMDVRRLGIHFLAAGGHKWLLAPMGVGGLFVSDEVAPMLHPARVGWKSVIDEEDFFNVHFDLKPDALRFETGTMNVAGIIALGTAVELLLEVGVEHIHRAILELNALFARGLQDRGHKVVTPMEEGARSGILSFEPPTDPDSLNRTLASRNVVVSLRGTRIRLSPHFYNNAEDAYAFFDALDR